MNGDLCIFNGLLYLCKQINQEIYVDDIESLSQLQIDGIRFIYKQLINKNPGVILNDPPGFGKCLLTVYFLKAVIHCLLTKPILIIAGDDDDLLKWIILFQKSGIDVESKNPLAKKQVYVTSTNNITLFNVKEWSVVVVHNNQISKELIHTNFKCEFKIWITSMDVKNNLKTLGNIYMWLTKEKLEIKQFIPDNNPYDIYKKSMLLDIFLEDIYFRTSYTFIPIVEEPKSEIISIKRQYQGTRRNKDATGSKIKKSKRRLDDEDLPDVCYENKCNGQDNIISIIEKNNRTEDFAVVSIDSKIASPKIEGIDNHNNAQNEPSEQLITIEQSDLKSNQTLSSQDGLLMESQSVSFGHAIQDIVDHEKNMKAASIIQEEDVNIFTEHASKDNADIENITKTEHEDINYSSFGHPIVDNENKFKCEPTTQEEDIHLKLETDLPNNMNISDDADSSLKISNADKPSQSIDSKLLELEEMALKKFKGSFLDSIF